MERNKFPLLAFILGVLFLVFWFNGGEEIVKQALALVPQPHVAASQAPAANSTATPEYDPPPPNPDQNGPEGDLLEHVKTLVPTEERYRVSVGEIFSLDSVKMNQYWGESVYKEVNTTIDIVTYVRARTAETHASMVWPDNGFSRTFALNQRVVLGTELAVLSTADALITVSTNPGTALAGITNIAVDGNTISITAEVPMKAGLLAVPISPEDNTPQFENSAKITPNPWVVEWLGISDRMPSESELGNLGVKVASKEAIWLLLHQDGESMWRDFKDSVENSGSDHAYDVIAPFIEKAFCQKLDSFQDQLEKDGKKLDRVNCDQMEFQITLIAVPPENPTTKQPDVTYLTMLRSGAYVQLPDPNYWVQP